jgi:hypothetical protein
MPRPVLYFLILRNPWSYAGDLTRAATSPAIAETLTPHGKISPLSLRPFNLDRMAQIPSLK